MADIVIGTATDGNDFSSGLDSGIVWTGENIGYFFFVEEGGDLVYKKTTDGGESFAAAVDINTDTIVRFSVWYDRWTFGDTGNIIHIAHMSFGNGQLSYESLNTSNDSQTNPLTIVSTTNADSNSDWRTVGVSITKARGGNLYIAEVVRNDANNIYREGFWHSNDGGAAFSTRAEVFENTGDAANTDRVILMPGNEADTNDIWGVFYDDSNTELSLKTYDESTDSWSETSIDLDVNVTGGGDVALGFAAVPRHSDNHIMVIAKSGVNSVTDDLHCYDINGSGSITTKTDVFTNEDDHGQDCSLFIDQNTDDLYAVYIGTPGETHISEQGIYYKKSSDGGGTWGSQVTLNEDSNSITRTCWTGVSVGSNGGRFQPCWSKDLTAASPDEYKTNFNNQVFLGGSAVSAIALSTQVIVDWDNDTVFETSMTSKAGTEEITQDIISMNWNRGKEPEQETTPTGTAVIVVNDPTGNYAPNSTFWDETPGDNNVELGREVRARTVHQGVTYPLFRGRISRIQPNVRPGNVQTATLFIVDAKELLDNKIVSYPSHNFASSPGATGGASLDPDDPVFGKEFGTSASDGIIQNILNQSSFSNDGSLRQITEGGSTADAYWTFGVSAKAALDEIERHEGKNSMLFVSSSGAVTFHSSTHRNGSASLAKFGTSSVGDGSHIFYQGIQFEMSNRNVLNSVDVSIITRTSVDAEVTSVQFIPLPNVTITTGSIYSWVVPLDKAPLSVVGPSPLMRRDSTVGVALVGVVSGTTYADDSHDGLIKTAVLGGGSAVRFTVENPGLSSGIDESISIHHPSTDAGYSGTTDDFPLNVRVFALSDVSFESCDPTSVARYGRRSEELKFPFFGSVDAGGANNRVKASDRATEELRHNSTAHPQGLNLVLQGTDSDSITQILTRDMNDRIEINSTATLHISNQDFYITRGEWSLDPGGHMGVVWTLQEAT